MDGEVASPLRSAPLGRIDKEFRIQALACFFFLATSSRELSKKMQMSDIMTTYGGVFVHPIFFLFLSGMFSLPSSSQLKIYKVPGIL